MRTNIVIIVGRVTRDAQYSKGQTENASSVLRFTVAVDRRMRGRGEQTQADFISCVAFGKLADAVSTMLTKGTPVSITGRLQTGKYTNKEGQTVYTTDVVVADIDLLETKAAADARRANQPAPVQAQAPAQGYIAPQTPAGYAGQPSAGYMVSPTAPAMAPAPAPAPAPAAPIQGYMPGQGYPAAPAPAPTGYPADGFMAAPDGFDAGLPFN